MRNSRSRHAHLAALVNLIAVTGTASQHDVGLYGMDETTNTIGPMNNVYDPRAFQGNRAERRGQRNRSNKRGKWWDKK
jgi:hypothetical protein